MVSRAITFGKGLGKAGVASGPGNSRIWVTWAPMNPWILPVELWTENRKARLPLQVFPEGLGFEVSRGKPSLILGRSFPRVPELEAMRRTTTDPRTS